MIRGTGVPFTEHFSTKSWPSMIVQSFRTLENEGATSTTASPMRRKSRQTISDHNWPILLADCSHPKSCRQQPHCPGHPGLPWSPGFALSIFILGNRYTFSADTWSLKQRSWQRLFHGHKTPPVWEGSGASSPLGRRHGLSCLVLTSAILEHHQSTFFPPFLVLLYFLMSLIFLMSHR